jgi:peptidoglycan/xylan/chitin deacetylase (PgdA/CDA1 family)
MTPATRRLAIGAGGVTAAALTAHLAPAASCWRFARCLVAPRLSGVGRPEHLALTFDDGPDLASTPAFLDSLDHLGWKATFFLLGTQVRRAGGLTAEIVARGHEVGVHGDRHANHLGRTASWATRDVLRARDSIAEAAGVTPVWFRPPYGALAASSLVAARRAGLQTVLWTCWGRDWRAAATPRTITDDIESARRPGATVLLHDSDVTSAPGSWKASLAALPHLAERWRPAGLVVGTLSDHGIVPGPMPAPRP